jgi:hypothetical protein
MTITLRQESAAGATTKNNTLTYKELDDNFVHLLDNKLSDVVADTTPQLGGALDAQSNNITNLGTLNTHTIPGGTGTIALTSDITFTEISQDTTPQLGGDLESNGNEIKMADATGLIRFNNTGMILFSNSGDSRITSTQPVSMSLNTGATQFVITDETPNTLFKVSQNGITELYHGTSKKFETASGGVSVTGTLNGHTIPGGAGTIALTSDITAHIDTQIVAGTDISVTQPDSGGAFTISYSGTPGLTDIVSDTTPQLGGPLDVNGNAIVTASGSNADIILNPDGSGKVNINNTYTLPNTDGTNGQVLTTNGTGTLSFTTVSGGASALNDLTDVNASGPTNGQVIQYNSGASQWQTVTLSFLSNVSEDTTPQLGGTLDCQDNVVQSPDLKDYKETVYSLGTTDNPSISISNGNVQSVTISSGLNLPAFTDAATGQSVTLIVSGSGSATGTGAYIFAGGNKTLTTKSIVSIFYDGTNYWTSISTDFQA